MDGNLYWISALVFAIVLAIILINDIRAGEALGEIEKSCRSMMVWVIFFCLLDIVWGLCSAGVIKGDNIFFFISMLFHISTVITTYFWLRFILEYLGKKIKCPNQYLILDIIVIAVEMALVIINFFKPVLFKIVDGKYVTGPLRSLTFFNQYIVYFAIGLATFICALKSKKEDRDRFIAVFMFTLAPILLGVFQYLYPFGPFYSMGYFLGCFMVHIFVVAKNRETFNRNKYFSFLADIYYTMHILDLEKDSVETLLGAETIDGLTNDINGCQKKLDAAMQGTVCEEYLDMIMDFVDLSTISERMKNRNSISAEFIGKNFGWTRVSFISVEKFGDEQKRVLITTQIVDNEKRGQIDLMYRSSHDELSGLYNRRAYEEELARISEEGIPEDLVYVSMDLNGLKLVNDTLGHAAGDEIINGGAACIKRAMGAFGKIYRTGGDEFAAIINADYRQVKKIKQTLDKMVKGWSGNLVESLSVSAGFVTRRDAPKSNINEIAILADKRMYEQKNEYYRNRGVDRRGQKNAHSVACTLFIKILQINLTDDSYQIVDLKEGELLNEGKFGTGISGWIKEFAASGIIHPDDLNYYNENMNPANIRSFFSEGNEYFSMFYRRLIGDAYKKVMLEIVPTSAYKNDNQELFLYVKCIEN